MIDVLYDKFKHWSEKGSVYMVSDTHFDDPDCIKMSRVPWISAEEHVSIIQKDVHKCDTLIHLGDVGNPEYLKGIKAYKVLICGNHDSITQYEDIFDEIYDGPIFISPKILLSHEPICGLSWCVNIHGHDHSGQMRYKDNMGGFHLNLAANVCGFQVVSLGKEIKNGLCSKTKDIHRLTIDKAIVRSNKRNAKTNQKTVKKA